MSAVIEAIGLPAEQQVTGVPQQSMGLEDFMKVFMTELNYQDPLKPVDNREFMAQMTQFSALELSNKLNANIESLLKVSSVNQALALIGKEVEVETDSASTGIGVVVASQIDPDGRPSLSIKGADDQIVVGISPNAVKLVRNAK